MVEKTHYDMEDTPPADVDTTLAMYEQSKAVVANGAALSDHLLSEAGPLLEAIYNAASAAQNADLMNAASHAWDKTQELAKIVGQQNAAINGADVVIGVIKESRQKVLDELNTILKGLDENDSAVHPKLEAWREEIEEYAREWAYEDLMHNDDSEYGFDTEMLVDEVFGNIEALLADVRFIDRTRVTQKFVDIIMGYDECTDEQASLFRQLFKSLEPAETRAPIEEADDYEEDEDGD